MIKMLGPADDDDCNIQNANVANSRNQYAICTRNVTNIHKTRHFPHISVVVLHNNISYAIYNSEHAVYIILDMLLFYPVFFLEQPDMYI